MKRKHRMTDMRNIGHDRLAVMMIVAGFSVLFGVWAWAMWMSL